MKLFLNPPAKKKEKLGSGVDVVVYQMTKHLQEIANVFLVPTVDEADIFATHISAEGSRPADVLHCHGLYPTQDRESDKWMWKINQLVIESAKKAVLVTVPSPWVAEIFQRDMGFTPEIIPHGLDLAEWKPRTLGQTPTILWNKNRNSDVCNPDPVNEIAAIAKDLSFVSTFGKATPNVKIVGSMPHPQMKELLYQSGIYLATTKETFGIGILEALICGLPVLAWNYGNAPYLVQHKVTGYIAQPGDYQDSVAGLHYITENWEELSKNAQAYAKRFSWKEVALQYLRVYEKALEIKEEEKVGRVSFVMPCHNYGQWVGEAIHSVRNQTRANIECIVIDDGSTDNSYEKALEAAGDDPRIRVIKQENQGVAATRNRGAMLAKGPFLSFLDADDRLRPEFVERLLPELQADRSLGISYGKLAIMDKDGNTTGQARDWPEDYSADKQLQKQNRIPACCLMRKEIFLRTGGFRQHTAPTEDAELWARFALIGYRGKLSTIKPVYDYRLHGNSASTSLQGKPAPDWTSWLAAANGGKVPFAAEVSKKEASHPVLDYDQPFISFIIPVGPDHVKHLQRALESVAGQTLPTWEAVVIDDTDEGDLKKQGSIPYEIAYPWVRWVRNTKLHNVSAARNQGAAVARGKYLCCLDADDYIYRDFMAGMKNVLDYCEGDARIVYSDWVSMPNGEVHKAENWNIQRLKDHALFAVTFAVPRSAYFQVGGFDESLDLWEDWDFTIKLALAGYVGIRVPKPLFAYCYDTGERREQSLENKDRLFKAIRGKYEAVIPAARRG